MFKPEIKQITEGVKGAIRGFFRDAGRIVGASKSTAAMMFIAFSVIGLWPLLELITLYGLVDALIGARTIGIWTGGVQTFMWYQVGLLAVAIPVMFFAAQLSGTTRRIGWVYAEALFIISLFFAALPVAPILLFVLLMAAFFAHYLANRYALLGYSVALIFLTVVNFSSILNITVHRGATVGQAGLYAGSLLVLSFWLALRPHLKVE